MVNKIIDEIKAALDNNLYFSALALSLILPDSCAKAEYPNEKSNAVRYKNWYKKYVGDSVLNDHGLPNITEDVAYNLRCSFLHEGNPNITDNSRIDRFELIFQEKVDGPDVEEIDDNHTTFHLKYFDVMGVDKSTNERYYKVNVRSYCGRICRCVEEYYNANKDKFEFNYTVHNWEDVKPGKAGDSQVLTARFAIKIEE